MLSTVLVVFHIIFALLLIILVLMQPDSSEASSSSAALGMSGGLKGASQTLFGSRGSASFITKLTAVISFCLCTTSLGLGLVYNHSSADEVMSLFTESSTAKPLKQ